MRFKTCVSVAEETPKSLARVLKKALSKSDLAEIRFDFLAPSDVPIALEMTKNSLKKTVCTLRPKSEGGRFSGTERERASILKMIAEYDPYMLDIEFNTIQRNKKLSEYVKKTKTRILVSWHDFEKTPKTSTLLKRLDRMKTVSNNVKIVTSAKTVTDASYVLSLYAKSRRINLVAFAMGTQGRISRILCLYLGSPFTYVSLGKAVAPGQFSLNEIKKIIDPKRATLEFK